MKHIRLWTVLLLLAALMALLGILSEKTDSSLHSSEEIRLASILSTIIGVESCEVFFGEVHSASGFPEGNERCVMIFCEGDRRNLSLILEMQRVVHTLTGIPIESIDICIGQR